MRRPDSESGGANDPKAVAGWSDQVDATDMPIRPVSVNI